MPDTASEIARLRAALAASEARAEAAESELAQTRAVVSTSEAMIKHLKLEIAKLRREHYGHSSERRARLIDQMELQLEELEAAATEDEIEALNVAKTSAVAGFERRRPTRKPFPDHLPRERIVIEAPTTCSCCGSDRIVKMGENITETLEVIPRQWKVIQTVREKFTCRICEKISQSPAPFHPNRHLAGWQSVLQADAYGGYNDLYRGGRDPGPVLSALCWSHARRKFFELADIKENARQKKPAHDISPVALEAVKKIDAIFDIERQINGLDVASRLEARHQLVRPLVEGLHDWMQTEQGTMSKHNPVAKAIAYMFKKDRWDAFTLFLNDGRICLTNNAAERALRGIALGRRSWLFAGSERGGDRAAFMYSLIVTAKMNDIDPQAWLADVLARLPSKTASRVPDLLPWNWLPSERRRAA